MAGFTRDKPLRIGELSRLSGFPVRTIRYYEERGLLEPAARSESGYRLYGRTEVERLRFIRRAKLLGLNLGEVSGLVALAADCSGEDMIPRLEEILEVRLVETRRKIAELFALRDNLLYYSKRLQTLDPEHACDRPENENFCGCLEAVAGPPATREHGAEEVNMKNLEVTQENGRLIAARDEGCDCDTGCCGGGCCEGERCGCC